MRKPSLKVYSYTQSQDITNNDEQTEREKPPAEKPPREDIHDYQN